MAITRYLAICHPLKARLILGTRASRLSLAMVFVFSCCFNIPRFLMETIEQIDCTEGYTVYIRYPQFRSARLRHTFGWLYFAVGIAVPLLVLIFCNTHLIRALHRASRQRQKMTYCAQKTSEGTRILTLTLIIIVIMYVVFVVPAEIVHFMLTKVQQHWNIKPVVNMLVAILNTMQALTFSVNFLLYCLINTHFRRTFRDLFFPCLKRPVTRTGGAYELVTQATTIAMAVRDCKTTEVEQKASHARTKC